MNNISTYKIICVLLIIFSEIVTKSNVLINKTILERI